MASPRMTKDAKRLHDLALSLGWSVDGSRKQQTRYVHPDAETPIYIFDQLRGGHGRAMPNIEAQLRRVAKTIDPAQGATEVGNTTPTSQTSKENTVVQRKRSPRHTTHAPAYERTVVLTKPFQAKHGMTDSGGAVYDSSAVLEVIFDNGEIEYRCSQCDYEHTNARSVAAHYSAKHGVKGGVAKQVKETGRVDPAVVWEPNKLQNAAISRLAGEIERAMASGAEGPLAIASSIVESRVRRGEVDPAEPIQALTSDQILARIRLIVDDGTVQRLTDEAAAAAAAAERAHAAEAELQEKLTASEKQLEEFRTSGLATAELLREIYSGAVTPLAPAPAE